MSMQHFYINYYIFACTQNAGHTIQQSYYFLDWIYLLNIYDQPILSNKQKKTATLETSVSL